MVLGSGIQDPGSGIRKKPIPDPGSRGQKGPDPGSGSATLLSISPILKKKTYADNVRRLLCQFSIQIIYLKLLLLN
jgi:hypothetical protein